MDRTTALLAGLLLSMTPLAFGQESQPAPQTPEDAFVMQRPVAWTRMQKPQPAPQPMPPQDTTVPEPDQQDRQGKQPVGEALRPVLSDGNRDATAGEQDDARHAGL